jgi:hypothetical protein
MTFDLRLDSVYRHPSRDIDGHLGGCLCVYTPLEGVDAIDGPMAGTEDVPWLFGALRRWGFPWFHP